MVHRLNEKSDFIASCKNRLIGEKFAFGLDLLETARAAIASSACATPPKAMNVNAIVSAVCLMRLKLVMSGVSFSARRGRGGIELPNDVTVTAATSLLLPANLLSFAAI
jgi:hypothetical protein